MHFCAMPPINLLKQNEFSGLAEIVPPAEW
jgi:hypothetical protein